MNSKAHIPQVKKPDAVSSYFRCEWVSLLIVAVTGILYNVGMVAGPWFEGQLTQTLLDVFGGRAVLADMIRLALAYVLVILFIQGMRYAKRFYVRRFANNVSRNMKHVLYRNLVHTGTPALRAEAVGTYMTKAIADTDACAEGMRKFTTEVFDTGVVLISYLAMLFYYDWRLALISCIFPPFAYLIAEKLKKTVSRSAALSKESAGRLSGDTLDRVSGALTYRALGEEEARDASFEERLADYEKKAVRAGILETAMQPLYQIIATLGVVAILWFGAKNISGTGWETWDIAAFTTFLACFARLALKAAKAAKLFNAVQKARVSWKRVRPLMAAVPADKEIVSIPAGDLAVRDLSFTYPGGSAVLHAVSFTAKPGQIIGITGPVACGKSTLGKVFLMESPCEGALSLGDSNLKNLSPEERAGALCYLGHEPELLSASIEENILLGDDGDAARYLDAVRMTDEVRDMPDGTQTLVGSGGVRLSGGQQARVALARMLCHRKPLIILDDPFAALDKRTEAQVFENLRALTKDSVVLLISHRLYLFPTLDKVLFMEDGYMTESTHEALLRDNSLYRELFAAQSGGENDKA